MNITGKLATLGLPAALAATLMGASNAYAASFTAQFVAADGHVIVLSGPNKETVAPGATITCRLVSDVPVYAVGVSILGDAGELVAGSPEISLTVTDALVGQELACAGTATPIGQEFPYGNVTDPGVFVSRPGTPPGQDPGSEDGQEVTITYSRSVSVGRAVATGVQCGFSAGQQYTFKASATDKSVWADTVGCVRLNKSTFYVKGLSNAATKVPWQIVDPATGQVIDQGTATIPPSFTAKCLSGKTVLVKGLLVSMPRNRRLLVQLGSNHFFVQSNAGGVAAMSRKVRVDSLTSCNSVVKWNVRRGPGKPVLTSGSMPVTAL